MIPAMALGAAVNAWRETPMGGDPLMKALEAAAPFIAAEAWEEGNVAGQLDNFWTPNPYRSIK